MIEKDMTLSPSLNNNVVLENIFSEEKKWKRSYLK